MEDVIRNRYLAGVTTSHVLKGAGMLSALWLTPFVLDTLGREQYGIYVLALSMAGWLRVCDLGAAAALQARLARLSEGIDTEPVSTLITAAFTAQLFTASIAFAMGLALAIGFPEAAGLYKNPATGTAVLVVLLSLEVSVSLTARVCSAILIARQRFHRDNAVQLVALGLRVLITIVLLLKGWGLTALAVALLSGSLLRLVLTLFESHRIAEYAIRRRLLSWRHLRNVGGLGLWFSVGGLAGLMILGVDSLLAAKLISIESVTVLYLTSRLYDLAEGMFRPIVDVARPALGALLGQREISKGADVYRNLESLTVACALVTGTSIWAVNREFLTAWVGSENYGGMWLNTALAAAFIVKLRVLPRRAVLSAALVVKPQSLARLCEGGLKVFLSVLLGGRLGLAGIALASSLANVATSAWYLERLTRRLFREAATVGGHLQIRAAVLFPLIAVALAGWGLTEAVEGYAGTVLGFVATATTASGIIWMVGVDAGTRSRLRPFIPVLAKGTPEIESSA
jgi:O-antigen/teichoic acid export membrane protein